MRLAFRLLSIALAASASGAAQANPLVYTPVNPTFGGSPLNGPFLLNRADAQNQHKDPNAPTAVNPFSAQSQLDQFNSALQQAILSRISAAVSSSVVGADGKLIPGTVQTQNFTISISDLGGGKLRIVTTDKLSGSSTSFEISQ
ncbi:curli assembly protein CsgF [Ramlibacter sp. G-1-2-2]|uniref:Curli production assembly/transport component CsgF n=1 Tax=Ramlibacter agri TaxID=2728837 RepID=A0A848HBN8_9BURK|nr:curli assembly protein CsgF [Ramlibacter agri]NML45903.1 curli assembly protein CsgF [Ramlibacter agri]